jgi:hypothetical protein
MDNPAFRMVSDSVSLRHGEDDLASPNLLDLPLGDLVGYLRSIAIERPDFEPAASVTLTGRQVLALADRLTRTAR